MTRCEQCGIPMRKLKYLSQVMCDNCQSTALRFQAKGKLQQCLEKIKLQPQLKSMK